jgi:hypothetical protein
MVHIRTDWGEEVRKRYRIPAVQVRYHCDGTFFMPLERFPGALADRMGYALFGTEEEYLKNPYLDHRGSNRNPRVGVSGGISKLPTYSFFHVFRRCRNCDMDVELSVKCKLCGQHYCCHCMEDGRCPKCGADECTEL